MAFSGRNIGGNDYSILDAYDYSQEYNKLIEKAATRSRKYRLETIENEYLEGGITKGGWYERRIVELQKLLEEETDGFQSLKIQNDILKLMDSKSSWEESQAKSAESYEKKMRKSAFDQMKEAAKAEDVDLAMALYNVSQSPMNAEEQAIARYGLLRDYSTLLEERKNNPIIDLYGQLEQGPTDSFRLDIDKKIAILTGGDTTETSFSIGAGQYAPSIKKGEIDLLRDQVTHIKGIKLTDSGEPMIPKFGEGNEVLKSDGKYLPVMDDEGYRLVPEEQVDENYVRGPYRDGDSETYYKIQEETVRKRTAEGEVQTDNRGKVIGEESVDRYVNFKTPDGLTVRVREKDGQWDWEHGFTKPTGVSEEELGIWALGYNNRDEMPTVRMDDADGVEQDVPAYGQDRILGMGREVQQEQQFSGRSAFDGLYLQDPHSYDVFTIEGGRKRKVDQYQFDPVTGEQPNIMVDDQGILDAFQPISMDADTGEIQPYEPNPDVIPDQFTDNLGRIRKQDGGFEFIEFNGSNRKSISVEEYAQRKGIDVQEALAGSENAQDILSQENDLTQFFQPTQNLSPYRSNRPGPIQPRQSYSPPSQNNYGPPKSRGFFSFLGF